MTLTPKIVSTTRYGYFFDNYHDFGWPTIGSDINWRTNRVGIDGNSWQSPAGQLCNRPAGTSTTPYDGTYTQFNASKHYQFNEDVAFFKGGWWGTHNFKVGYQFNHCPMSSTRTATSLCPMYLGRATAYVQHHDRRNANCATLDGGMGSLRRPYGYSHGQDFATILTQAGDRPEPCVLRPGCLDRRSWSDAESWPPHRKRNLARPRGRDSRLQLPTRSTSRGATRSRRAWEPHGTRRAKAR